MTKDLVENIAEIASSESSYSYYEKNFRKIEAGKTLTWNWSAAIFSIFWMIYHKMHKELLLYALFSSIFEFVRGVLIMSGLIFPNQYLKFFLEILVFVIVFFCLGLWGNWFLYKSCKKKSEKGYSLESGYCSRDDNSVWGMVACFFLTKIAVFVLVAVALSFVEFEKKATIAIAIFVFLFCIWVSIILRLHWVWYKDSKRAKKVLQETLSTIETEADADAETEAETEADAETEAETEADAETESEVETEADVETESEVDTESDTELSKKPL